MLHARFDTVLLRRQGMWKHQHMPVFLTRTAVVVSGAGKRLHVGQACSCASVLPRKGAALFKNALGHATPAREDARPLRAAEFQKFSPIWCGFLYSYPNSLNAS